MRARPPRIMRGAPTAPTDASDPTGPTGPVRMFHSVVDSIRKGAVSADKEVMERVLKKRYQSEPACRMAARLAAGASVADLLDGDDGEDGGGRRVTRFLDFFNEIALMLCVGMSEVQIALFYGAMVLTMIALVVLIMRLIPDSVWTTCKRNGRQGTPEECRNAGFIFEFFLAVLVSIAVLSFVRAVFRMLLKLMVYKLSALVVETAVRAVA